MLQICSKVIYTELQLFYITNICETINPKSIDKNFTVFIYYSF